MRWLISAMPRSRAQGEKGAVATLFAVLVAGGLVIGMLALTVDVGGIWVERRELQNSADAASMSLASTCAKKAADCDPTVTPASLNPLINGNAGADQKSQLLGPNTATKTNGQCARIPSGKTFPNMPTCASASTDAPISQLTECPALPAWLRGSGANLGYVEVYTQTQSNGSTILPKAFSQALAGGPGPDASVAACARAAWGPPGNYAATIPMTFSMCEFNYYTAENGAIADPPGPLGYGSGPGQTPLPSASKEKVIYLKASNSSPEPRSCRVHNVDFPGAFGWVANTGCQATVQTGGWLDTLTGTSVPNECKPFISASYQKVISIPVFDCVQPGGSVPTAPVSSLDCSLLGNGTKAWYHVAGWAKFYISGYNFPSLSAASPYRGVPCASNESCVSGWFVSGSLDATSIDSSGTGTDFGTYTVLPAG